MKLKIIWFIIFLFLVSVNLISVVMAQEIEINYQDEVSYEEEFEINIKLIDFEEDVYDVKIDILNEENRIARIWDGEDWQSTFNYINEIIDLTEDDEKTFNLKITESYEGVADIEIKIRDSNGDFKIFSDYTIEVVDDNYNGGEEDPNEEIDFEWDEEDIINNVEFDIEINIENMGDEDYDIKLWIEDDDENIISERYDDEKEGWKSGNYYIDDFFIGPGDDNEKVALRIKEEYLDFDGDATIFLKIRDVDEIEDNIEILKNEINDDDDDENLEKYIVEDDFYKEYQERLKNEDSKEVIKLGLSSINQEQKDIKTEKNIVYQSKSEIIKKYSMSGFVFLIIVLCILLFWNKIKI